MANEAVLNGTILEGTMKIIPDSVIDLEPGSEMIIESGYYSGNTVVRALDLASQTPGNATSRYILYGYSGWVNGRLVTGELATQQSVSSYSMIRRNGDNIRKYEIYFQCGVYVTPTENGNPEIKVPDLSLAQAGNLTPIKIAAGRKILGVTGTYTADATATADDIKYGYVGYSNGERIIGTLKTTQISAVSPTVTDQQNIIISWNNPRVGPYAGVKIWVSTDSNINVNTTNPVYTGVGSNTSAGGRSSVSIGGLKAATKYYFFIRAYCGTLQETGVLSTTATTQE